VIVVGIYNKVIFYKAVDIIEWPHAHYFLYADEVDAATHHPDKTIPV
jgi:hypothetical protein